MDEALIKNPPKLLRVICTLSIINGIYGMISSLVNAMMPKEVDGLTLDDLFARLEELKLPFEHWRADMEQYFLNTMLQMSNISAASFLFYGLSLIGAAMMLRLRRTGLVLYAVAQAGLAFVPSFFGGFNNFGWASLTVAGTWNLLWVVLYLFQLKHLR